MSIKIVVVEDEISINDILSTALRSEGYSVRSGFTAKEGREIVEKFKPDLALLDLNLPDENGFELCKTINSKYLIPIIILTARNDIVDKILGLELGADDYITKPFHIKEVLVRVKTALRCVDKYKFKGESEFIDISTHVKINIDSRIVLKNDEEVRLKPQEYDLFEFLVKHKNRVFSREELLNQVWGLDYDGDIRTVDVHIRRLRSKLDSNCDKSLIDTVFGVGYVMR
ncbi:MAG: response regulator transcription factor [Clostridium sp.]|uniref:response regulator transcription factor n=1 Tax=Clostridium sp. TaxID=1506 RepID=UPI00303C5FB1